MSMTVTNIDQGRCLVEAEATRNVVLAFAGADVLAEGTLIARREAVTAITPAADEGNTGDGTCTLASVVAGGKPKIGTYVLTCIAEVAHGGIFKLVDPDGGLVAGYLPMTAGAGVATAFEVGGLAFTLTDGDEDFDIGDIFTLPVVADGKCVPFAIDGVGSIATPIGVLSYPVTATGSGNIAAQIVAAGTFRKERMIIDADGDDTNLSESIIDGLYARGIKVVNTKDISVLDNQ
jgi:hypothetical protein